MMSNASIHSSNGESVQINGELTFNSTPGLYQELESRFKSTGQIIDIDLQAVDRTDSSGLALLLEWQAMANLNNRKLRIRNSPSNSLMLAKLCEADMLLDISGR